jgi:Holliday junction resolvase-like predicted endonuclease
VEVDVIVKCPHLVLFVEIPASGESPEEPAASDVTRTYLLRLVDAGLAYSQARAASRRHDVAFSLLILARETQTEKAWEAAMRALTRSEARLRRSFPHRQGFDPAVLMGNLGIASWSSMRRVLSSLRDKTRDDFEAGLLDRLLRPDKLSAPRASR